MGVEVVVRRHYGLERSMPTDRIAKSSLVDGIDPAGRTLSRFGGVLYGVRGEPLLRRLRLWAQAFFETTTMKRSRG